jgi:hypothetical protein
MPLLIEGTRFMVDQLAARINEVIFGFDGSVATQEDGGAGQPGIAVTPTVRVVDDHSIFIEAILPLEENFSRAFREVVLQYRNPTDATDSTAIFRYTFNGITKDNRSEIRFTAIIEVSE